MAARANGGRVRGENSDERSKQTLKDMNKGKTRKKSNEELKASKA